MRPKPKKPQPLQFGAKTEKMFGFIARDRAPSRATNMVEYRRANRARQFAYRTMPEEPTIQAMDMKQFQQAVGLYHLEHLQSGMKLVNTNKRFVAKGYELNLNPFKSENWGKWWNYLIQDARGSPETPGAGLFGIIAYPLGISFRLLIFPFSTAGRITARLIGSKYYKKQIKALKKQIGEKGQVPVQAYTAYFGVLDRLPKMSKSEYISFLKKSQFLGYDSLDSKEKKELENAKDRERVPKYLERVMRLNKTEEGRFQKMRKERHESRLEGLARKQELERLRKRQVRRQTREEFERGQRRAAA